MGEWKKCSLSKVTQFGNGKRKPDGEGNIPIFGGNGVLGYGSESNYDGETIIVKT